MAARPRPLGKGGRTFPGMQGGRKAPRPLAAGKGKGKGLTGRGLANPRGITVGGKGRGNGI